MRIVLLFSVALVFPLFWGWGTFVVVSRFWPRRDRHENDPDTRHDVDPLVGNYQI
jgi:hypothetical protein